MPKQRTTSPGEIQLERVRAICADLPETTEKLSHGEPTFFVNKKVYVMFSNTARNAPRCNQLIKPKFHHLNRLSHVDKSHPTPSIETFRLPNAVADRVHGKAPMRKAF